MLLEETSRCLLNPFLASSGVGKLSEHSISRMLDATERVLPGVDVFSL
jgi:hypothetical protein